MSTRPEPGCVRQACLHAAEAALVDEARNVIGSEPGQHRGLLDSAAGEGLQLLIEQGSTVPDFQQALGFRCRERQQTLALSSAEYDCSHGTTQPGNAGRICMGRR